MTKDFLREDSKMLEYISAPEAAKKWGISERRVQELCEENAYRVWQNSAVCG